MRYTRLLVVASLVLGLTLGASPLAAQALDAGAADAPRRAAPEPGYELAVGGGLARAFGDVRGFEGVVAGVAGISRTLRVHASGALFGDAERFGLTLDYVRPTAGGSGAQLYAGAGGFGLFAGGHHRFGGLGRAGVEVPLRGVTPLGLHAWLYLEGQVLGAKEVVAAVPSVGLRFTPDGLPGATR